MYSVSRRATTGTIPRTLDVDLRRLDPYLLKTRAPRTQEEEQQQKEEEETVAAATMRTMTTAAVATIIAAAVALLRRDDDLYYEYCIRQIKRTFPCLPPRVVLCSCIPLILHLVRSLSWSIIPSSLPGLTPSLA